MRKTLLLVITALLILTSSSLAADELYDGWNYHDDVFTAGGRSITVQFPGGEESFPDRVVLRWDGNTIILNEGDCEDEDQVTLCYVESDDATPLDHQFTRWKAHLHVEEDATEVMLSRVITPNEIMPGEKFTVTTTFANQGDQDATEGSMVDSYPADQFRVFWRKGDCDVRDNTVTWDGLLSIAFEKECSYDIEAIMPGTYSSTATLTYLEGSSQQSVTDTKTLTVQDVAMHIESSHKRAVVELDGSVTLFFSLVNENDDLPVDVNHFEIAVPQGISIEQRKGFPYRGDDRLRYTGRVEPGQNATFEIELHGTFAGDYVLDVSLEYREGAFIRDDALEIPFTVFMDDPSVKVVVDQAHYISGQEGRFTINVTNPSDLYTIYNIRGEVESDIPGLGQPTTIVSSLDPSKSVTLQSSTFLMPDHEATILARVWYENDRGQKTTFEKELSIPLRAKDAVSDGEAEEDQEGAREQTGPEEGQDPASSGQASEAFAPFLDFLGENLALILITFFALIVVGVVVSRLMRRKKDSLYAEAAEKIKQDLEGKGPRE